MNTTKYFKVIYRDFVTNSRGMVEEVLKEEVIEWNVSKYDEKQSYRNNLNFASLTILDAGFVDCTPPSGSPVKFVPVHCIVQITEHIVKAKPQSDYNPPEKSIAFGKESVDAFNVNPKCGCSDCNPGANWMIVCSECGNKRCPKAKSHGNTCTNSNEVGQKGSAWEHVAPINSNNGQKRFRKQRRIDDDKDEVVRNNPEDAENKIVVSTIPEPSNENPNESSQANENKDGQQE